MKKKEALSLVLAATVLSGMFVGFPLLNTVYADEYQTVTESVYDEEDTLTTDQEGAIPLVTDMTDTTTVTESVYEPVVVTYSDRVYDKITDKGIEGVRVVATNKETEEEFMTRTDEEGIFSLELLEGEYTIELIRKGYKPVQIDIVIESEDRL